MGLPIRSPANISRGLDMCRQCFREKVSPLFLHHGDNELMIQSKAIGFVKVRRGLALRRGRTELTITEQLEWHSCSLSRAERGCLGLYSDATFTSILPCVVSSSYNLSPDSAYDFLLSIHTVQLSCFVRPAHATPLSFSAFILACPIHTTVIS
jgi:hypothetical protein